MLFPSCQTVKIKWLDELAFVLSFLLLAVISKRELIGKWNSSPTSFQGWQLFFSFIIFICLLIHPRIRNEVKILNRSSLILTLPVCISYTLAVSSGAVALTKLPVSVFLAWSNLCPAILALAVRRNQKFKIPVILGSAVVCLSIVIIFMIDSTQQNRLFYLYLSVHVVINLVHSLYIKKINLQIPDFTIVFYTNFISFISLFPFSIYSATQSHPGFGQILPCLFVGFLNLSMQVFSFRVKAKNTRFLMVQGIAQFMTILSSFYMFENNLDLWILGLVGINWFTTGFILNFDEDVNKSNQFILIVPHMTKNVYVEKYINYNDMA